MNMKNLSLLSIIFFVFSCSVYQDKKLQSSHGKISDEVSKRRKDEDKIGKIALIASSSQGGIKSKISKNIHGYTVIEDEKGNKRR